MRRAMGVRILAIAVAASWLSACSFMNGSHTKVWISTNVPAKIYADQRLIAETNGKEPVETRLRRGKDYLFQVKSPGYQDARAQLSRSFSVLGTLDLIGAMLIGVPVVTFATGHAYGLDPAHLHIDLMPNGYGDSQ